MARAKQISAWIEDRPGMLGRVADALGERGVSIRAFTAAVLSEVVIVGWMPYTWSGGGGPPGNRYFLGVYPALFFLMPPVQGLVVPVLRDAQRMSFAEIELVALNARRVAP